MRFYFFLRKSEEKIWECVAENKQTAWSFFSQRKRLDIESLKNLYIIKKLSYAKGTDNYGRFIDD
mgnify:CR=1 FL=1|tara:strand:+ start:180 stop:374 length:195 start_codon:yes stop_codon:yes gene_type:complete